MGAGGLPLTTLRQRQTNWHFWEAALTTTAQQIESRISAISNLPTLPEVVQKVSKMASDRNSTAADVAEVISMDPVLCSKILRMVNSPIYGFPGRISTIKHALVLLGFNVVKGLVLGSSVFAQMANERNRALWEHSLGCAVLSRRIAREMGMPDVEEVMVAGLLHDMGKVVLAHLVPQEYDAALERAKEGKLYIGHAEKELLGVDHGGIGAKLSEFWCFPPRLAEPLEFHHNPMAAKKCRDVTAIVHLADVLARGMGYGFPGDMNMPILNQEAFQSLKLTFSQLDTIIADADAEFAAGAAIFSGD
jgi:putative nucleotidyltransferase with HDIG domain